MEPFLDLVKDIWEFFKVRKKYWLAPLINYYSSYGNFDSGFPRISCSSFHIYFVLKN